MNLNYENIARISKPLNSYTIQRKENKIEKYYMFKR